MYEENLKTPRDDSLLSVKRRGRSFLRVFKDGGAAAIVMAVVFSLVSTAGYAFNALENGEIASTGEVIGAFGIFLPTSYCIICAAFWALDRCAKASGLEAADQDGRHASPSLATRLTDSHPFAVAFAVTLVCFLPHYLAAAPGIFYSDSLREICQWFHIPNSLSSIRPLVNPDVYLTAHHPVMYTALLGIFSQFGLTLFGSANAGLLVLGVLQYLFACASVGYAHSTLSKLNVCRAFRIGALAFVAIVPLFANYACSITKDGLFACLLLFFLSLLSRALFLGPDRFGNAQWVYLGVCSFLVSELRNGMVLCAIAGLVALIVFGKQLRRTAATVLVGVVCFWMVCSFLLFPALGVTPGSIREVLSVPFQQTARTLLEHPDEVSAEDRLVIESVLGPEDIAQLYNPRLSDNVKSQFDESASRDDLLRYFTCWARMGLEHPDSYTAAYFANYYGYLYYTGPSGKLRGRSESQAIVDNFAARQIEWAEAWHNAEVLAYWTERQQDDAPLFDYRNYSTKVNLAVSNAVDSYVSAFESIFPFAVLLSSPFYIWLLALDIAWAVHRRRSSAVIVFAPLLMVVLACFISPASGAISIRYVYPVAFCLPFATGAQMGKVSRTLTEKSSITGNVCPLDGSC